MCLSGGRGKCQGLNWEGVGTFRVNVDVWMKCPQGPKTAPQAVNRQGREKTREGHFSVVRIWAAYGSNGAGVSEIKTLAHVLFSKQRHRETTTDHCGLDVPFCCCY